jgi:hypothetical protein
MHETRQPAQAKPRSVRGNYRVVDELTPDQEELRLFEGVGHRNKGLRHHLVSRRLCGLKPLG